MVLTSPVRTVYNPDVTILGHLRGLYVGDKYSYNWAISTMNLQVGLRMQHPQPKTHTLCARHAARSFRRRQGAAKAVSVGPAGGRKNFRVF